MPTIIPAELWEPIPDRLETDCGPNHGQPLTTEAITTSMDEVDSRPEMRRLDERMMPPPNYLKRRNPSAGKNLLAGKLFFSMLPAK